MTREGALMRRIMLAVSEAGAIVFRNNVGVAVYPSGATVRYGVGGNGGADLVGLAPGGRFLAIEVKAPGERATVEQQRFIDAVKAAGGVAGVCRSVEEALALLGTPR